MDYSKAVYIKYDDLDKLLENLKSVMANNDMQFVGKYEDKYEFDRYGDYSRSFVVKQADGGWSVLFDDSTEQTEDLCLELSENLSCFIMCIGKIKDVLYYTLFDCGEQTGQYMSSLKYYEYPVDEEVEEFYKGDAKDFKKVLKEEDLPKLQKVLDDLRDENIDLNDAVISIQIILGLIENGSDEEDAEEEPDMSDIDSELEGFFYVDFESINIKTEDIDRVKSSIEQILKENGYTKVDEFKNENDEKKGFLKRIINTVKERKRIQFFITSPCNGWITLVGEITSLYGNEASQWEFLHIEDRLSDLLKAKVINIYADMRSFGFKVFDSGELVYEYNSGDVIYIEDIQELLQCADEDTINSIFERDINSPEDADDILEKFCKLLGIENYRINIPMDYSEEEYYKSVLSKLPCKGEIIRLKFEEDK